VTFEFVDASGKPVAGALLYLHHTSAKGWYSDKAAHIQANSGDYKHARLFGYAITDANGRIEVHTIRPASYPNTNLPQHIHMHLSVGGKEVMVSQLLFEDDPMLTRGEIEQAERSGYFATQVEKAGDGSQKCKAVFRVK
jgi:protocatechuate 3,4-dioxygenase, beta subunit